MKVKAFLSNGTAVKVSEVFEVPDDSDDSEIEVMVREWALERVEWWFEKEDESDD